MSIDVGFDLSELDDFNQRMLELADRQFPNETKKFIRRQVYGDNVFEKCGINRDGAGEVGKPRYFNGKRHF